MTEAATPDKPEEEVAQMPPNAVRAIYAMVIIMSMLIVAGVALLIGRIIYLANASGKPTTMPATVGQPAPDLALTLPAGATVAETSLSGNRLVVRYTAGGQEALLIFDLVTGRTLSKIALPRGAVR